MADRLKALRGLVRRPTIRASRMAVFLSMAIIFAIALMYRLQPASYGYTLDEFDSYFHYYATNIIVNDVNTKGLAGLLDFFKVVDTHFWYPEGYNMATSTFAGFYYTTAILYLFLTKVLGVNMSLFDYTVIQPAYVGALMVVPAFLLGRKIKGTGTGIMAALLTILTPGFLVRSSVGWYKHEPISLLAGVMSMYLAVESYEAKTTKKTYLYAALAGLALGYSNTVWGGGRYFNGLLGIMFVAVPLLMTVDYRKSLAGVVTLLVNVAVGSAFPNPGLMWFKDAANVIMALGIVAGLVVIFAAKRLPDRNKLLGKWGALAVMGALALVVVAFWLPSDLTARYLAVINPFSKSSEAIVQSVAEHQSSSGLELLRSYYLPVVFAILGGYLLLKKRRPGSILAVLGFLTALYVASSFARLQVYLSITAAILGAVTFDELTSRFLAMKVDLKRRTADSSVNAKKAVYVVLIVFLLFYPAWQVWLPVTNRPMQLTSAAMNLRENKPDWQQALTWIATNTPPDAKIISWWDYGYWITVLGHRTTFADNGTLNTTRIAEIGRMYMSNETEALKIAQGLGGDYIVVFVTYVDLRNGFYTLGRLYGLGGDDGKFDWMAKIAGMDINQFVDPRTQMPNYYFWNSTLIGMMMPLDFKGYAQIDPTSGQIMNISPGYTNTTSFIQLPVYTYDLKYPAGSHPFSLVFKSSGDADGQGFIGQVLIYKVNP